MAIPSSDTIAVVSDGAITGMPHRDSLVRGQTPQGFRLSVIRKAHELAAADPGFADLPATDDCGVVLRYLPEVGVHVVPGSERNIKITFPRDLGLAEALLSDEEQPGDAAVTDIAGEGRRYRIRPAAPAGGRRPRLSVPREGARWPPPRDGRKPVSAGNLMV